MNLFVWEQAKDLLGPEYFGSSLSLWSVLGALSWQAAWSRDHSVQGSSLVHFHVCPSSPAPSVFQLFSPSTTFPGLNSSSDHVPAVPNTPLLISYQVRATVASMGCSSDIPVPGRAVLTFFPSEGVRQETQTSPSPCPFPEACCISQQGTSLC